MNVGLSHFIFGVITQRGWMITFFFFEGSDGPSTCAVSFPALICLSEGVSGLVHRYGVGNGPEVG